MRRICRLCNEISEIFGGRDDALPSPHPIFIFLVGSVSITRCCKRIGGAWWHMIVSLYEYTHFFLQQFTVTIRMMHLTKAVFCLTVLHFSNYYLQIIVQFSISMFFCFLFYVSGSISPWTHISKQCWTRQGYCFRVAGLMLS